MPLGSGDTQNISPFRTKRYGRNWKGEKNTSVHTGHCHALVVNRKEKAKSAVTIIDLQRTVNSQRLDLSVWLNAERRGNFKHTCDERWMDVCSSNPTIRWQLTTDYWKHTTNTQNTTHFDLNYKDLAGVERNIIIIIIIIFLATHNCICFLLQNFILKGITRDKYI